MIQLKNNNSLLFNCPDRLIVLSSYRLIVSLIFLFPQIRIIYITLLLHRHIQQDTEDNNQHNHHCDIHLVIIMKVLAAHRATHHVVHCGRTTGAVTVAVKGTFGSSRTKSFNGVVFETLLQGLSHCDGLIRGDCIL